MTRSRKLTKKALWLLPLILVVALAVPVSASVSQAGSAPAAKAAPVFQGGNDLSWQMVANAPGVFWYTVYFPTPSVGYALGGPDWNVNDGIGPALPGQDDRRRHDLDGEPDRQHQPLYARPGLHGHQPLLDLRRQHQQDHVYHQWGRHLAERHHRQQCLERMALVGGLDGDWHDHLDRHHRLLSRRRS